MPPASPHRRVARAVASRRFRWVLAVWCTGLAVLLSGAPAVDPPAVVAPVAWPVAFGVAAAAWLAAAIAPPQSYGGSLARLDALAAILTAAAAASRWLWSGWVVWHLTEATGQVPLPQTVALLLWPVVALGALLVPQLTAILAAERYCRVYHSSPPPPSPPADLWSG